MPARQRVAGNIARALAPEGEAIEMSLDGTVCAPEHQHGTRHLAPTILVVMADVDGGGGT